MKVLFNVFVYLFVPAFQFFGFSQVIWYEDFESYSEGTGCVSAGELAVFSGDYPSLVSKWTLEVNDYGFYDSNTHFKVS